MQLPLGLFGVAIGSATLPAISRSAAAGNMDEFRRTLSRSIGMVFLLTIPSSAGLAILGPSMIAAIYQGGSFDAYDTEQTARALIGFSLGLAGYSAMKVLTPAFYALKDSRTPMLVSGLNVAVNYVSAYSLLEFARLRHQGLAFTTSAVALFNFVCLFLIMRSRIGGIDGRALLSSSIRIGVASMAMGIALVFLSAQILGAMGTGKLGHVVNLAAGIPAGAAIFWAVSRWLGIPELELASRAAAKPLGRLFPGWRVTLGASGH
jgi:putative peptidoglycan lipid II flippase